MKKVILDKHALYLASVQDPVSDVARVSKIYKDLFNRDAVSFREDFSGTFALSCCWVQSAEDRVAIAIDIDEETVNYGITNYLNNLSDNEKSRITPLTQTALVTTGPVDIIATFNFSYCLLHERKTLFEYFSHALNSLNNEGMLILDIFGGSDSEIPEVQERDIENHDFIPNFLFEFERKDFNPISRIANYGIHFKYENGEELIDAFKYEFRMWSITEVRDLLKEVGFSSSKIFWERCDDEGFGNGEFYETELEENSVNWNAYIVGIK